MSRFFVLVCVLTLDANACVLYAIAASLSTWNNATAQDEPMDVESDDAAAAAIGTDHNYAARNDLLRECHYLRQLRKFQSERMRERASYLERRSMDASTQYMPPQPRY